MMSLPKVNISKTQQSLPQQPVLLSWVMNKKLRFQLLFLLDVLYAGEDGRLAYEQLDKFPRDCVHVGGRHGTEVATAF